MKKAWNRAHFITALSVWAVSLLMGGCASDKAEFEKNCVLPSDQSATLSGHWPILPVPLSFYSGSAFTTTGANGEIPAIMAAADSWNAFYNSSKNLAGVLNYGTSSNPTMTSQGIPGDLCGTHILNTSGYTSNVAIYKQLHWTDVRAYNPQVVALTSYCTAGNVTVGGGASVPVTYTAIIELNYQNFFTSGHQMPDLQSIALHELGHLLGLAHACESTAGSGMPGCSATGTSADYLAAVMAPTVKFPNGVNGEVKRDLKKNDMSRANCLY